jgi:hypothetical protein
MLMNSPAGAEDETETYFMTTNLLVMNIFEKTPLAVEPLLPQRHFAIATRHCKHIAAERPAHSPNHCLEGWQLGAQKFTAGWLRKKEKKK